MISMSVVGLAGAAATYFAKDNYYTREQNEAQSSWAGTLAKEIGLRGPVDAATFSELLSGRIGATQLGKTHIDEKGEAKTKHLAGYDITFSAPKSVSILAEVFGRADVRAAHEAAVKTTLEFIERDYVRARFTTNGVTVSERTGRAIFALFHHNTSRALDPQTHTHAVLANITLREDGQYRAIDFRDFFRREPRHFLDAVYKTELAKNLAELGYRIEKTGKGSQFEIAGFTRAQLESFSSRSRAIEAKLAERGLSREDSTGHQRVKANQLTRDRKQAFDREEVVQRWMNRAGEVGIELNRVRLPEPGSVDRAPAQAGPASKAADARLHVLFAIQHLTEREVLVSREEILKVAGQHAHGRYGIAALDQAFWKVTEESVRVRGASGESREAPMLKQSKDGRWMLQKAYDSEHYVVGAVRTNDDKVQAITTLIRANEALDRLEAEAKSRDPVFEYSAEQRHAARLVATTPVQYLNIQGDAGSGKTTVLRAIAQMAQGEGFQVRGMAVTGNAAQALSEATQLPAQTVARFLLLEREAARTARAFDAIDQGAHPRPKALWVVDEASMLGQVDFARLVHYADEARAHVLFVGDRHQLHAVPAGKPWEIVQAYGSPKAELRDNIRQRDPGERLAVDRVKRREHIAALRGLAELGKVIVDASPLELVGRLAREWQARAREGEAPLVGVVTHRARLAVNDAIRSERRTAGDIRGPELDTKILEPAQWTRAQIRSAVSYVDHEGPLVVRFRRDYRSIGVKRGEYGRVGRIDQELGRLTLEVAGRQVFWTPTRAAEVEVYREASRSIAPGDWIVVTRDHGDLGNKSRWEVLTVDRQAETINAQNMTTGRTQSIDLGAMPHWDHAYARTLHSLQGTTAQRVMLFVESLHPVIKDGRRTDAVLDQIFGTQGFYVGVTRQREGLTIYTNDDAALGGAIRKVLEKTSAMEGMRELPGLPRTSEARREAQWRQLSELRPNELRAAKRGNGNAGSLEAMHEIERQQARFPVRGR